MVSKARRVLALGVSLSVFGGYAALATWNYAASQLADTWELGAIQRALAMQPGNADLWHRWGLLHTLNNESAKAVDHYRAAISLNPHDSRYWISLANAYHVLGDSQGQAQAIERAVRADPMNLGTVWEAANLYVVNGNAAKARKHLATIVALDPDVNKRRQALYVAWRASESVESVLTDVAPDNPDSQLLLLDILSEQGDKEGARQVWERVAQLHQPFDERAALRYVNYLLLNRETDQAERVWRDLGNILPAFAAYQRSGNLVVNAGFEEPIRNGGFDWRGMTLPHVEVTLDTSQFYAGLRSLKMRFNGKGPTTGGVYQVIPVEPGATYMLRGAMKGASLESASGARFIIADPFSNHVYAGTDELAGSHAWHELKTRFTVPPDIRQVYVMVAQLPTPRLMKGTLWIDDIEVRRQ